MKEVYYTSWDGCVLVLGTYEVGDREMVIVKSLRVELNYNALLSILD